MGKYILGIIAIACVQVAFTAYSRIDQSFETVRLSPEPSVTSSDTRPAELPEESEFAGTTQNKNIRRAPVRKVNVVAAVAKPRNTDHSVPRLVARRELVKPRQRIEYSSVKASDRTALNRADDPRDKKRRSIFAKALPVVKKPYDWARSLVAMLR